MDRIGADGRLHGVDGGDRPHTPKPVGATPLFSLPRVFGVWGRLHSAEREMSASDCTRSAPGYCDAGVN